MDACIHAAALSPAKENLTIEYIQNNVVGTQNLIRSLQTKKTCRHLIFLSGVSVYGRVQERVVNEETLPVNPAPYGISKLLCERLLMEQDDIPFTVLRLPGVLGSGSTTPWLVKQIQKALKNNEIQVYNPESLFNNAVWVDDLTKFIHSLLKKSQLPTKNILLLGASQPIKIHTLIEKIITETKSKSNLILEDGNQSFLLNWEKARSYKYSPRTTKQMLLAQIKYETTKKMSLISSFLSLKQKQHWNSLKKAIQFSPVKMYRGYTNFEKELLSGFVKKHRFSYTKQLEIEWFDKIHQQVASGQINEPRMHCYSELNKEAWARPTYYSMARKTLEQVVGNELVMQNRININIMMPGDSGSNIPIHIDVHSGGVAIPMCSMDTTH